MSAPPETRWTHKNTGKRQLAIKPPGAARRKAFPRGEGGFFIAPTQGDEKDG